MPEYEPSLLYFKKLARQKSSSLASMIVGGGNSSFSHLDEVMLKFLCVRGYKYTVSASYVHIYSESEHARERERWRRQRLQRPVVIVLCGVCARGGEGGGGFRALSRLITRGGYEDGEDQRQHNPRLLRQVGRLEPWYVTFQASAERNEQ